MLSPKGLSQDIGRISEILRIMRKFGFTPQLGPKWVNSPSDSAPSISKAERFTQMLEELGPTFIKLGQLLSTRADLLPPDFIASLSRLQDNAPSFPVELVKEQIETAFQKPLNVIFTEFDETPLASASIAQVHKAVLQNGDTVVVKVRRPHIENQIAQDASVLVLIAQLLEWVLEEASSYRAVELANEFRQALEKEIDFRIEANHLEQFAKNNRHRPSIYVPRIYKNLCCSSILTMEYIQGKSLQELSKESPDIIKVLMENLLTLGFEHVFEDGLFHADPHPGNLFISSDHRIVFIDFGLMGHLTRDYQDRLMAILIALSLKDADTLSRLLIHLGTPRARVNVYQFRDGIRELLNRYGGQAIGDIPAGSALADMLALSLRFGIQLPKELALLSKASITLEGVVRQLCPSLDVTQILAQKAEKQLWERMDPRNFETTGKRTALQLLTLAQDLPTQINQTLLDMERGDLSIQIRSKDLEQIEHTLRILGLVGFSAILSLGLLGGAFWLLTSPQATVPLWLPIGLFLLCGFIFANVLGWVVTRGKIPKFSLRWLKKLRSKN